MSGEHRVVQGRMNPRERGEWKGPTVRRKKTDTKRLLRNASISAAVLLCLFAVGGALGGRNRISQAVMSHVTTDFEIDDSLGRLQFVSSILPESAMVFLQGADQVVTVSAPVRSQETHAWTQEEPWLEYVCTGVVTACSEGDVMTIVQNREGEYTVRLRHENGFESIYSGMSEVNLREGDHVLCGNQVGWTDGFSAFELRQDGLSVQPVFSDG